MPDKLAQLFSSKVFSALFLTLFCFGFTWFFFGFYYVEYEGLTDSFFSGQLTSGEPFRSLYFIINHGISYFYSALYQVVPHVEWLSWFYYAYLYICCCFAFYLIFWFLDKKVSLNTIIAVQILVFFLVFANQLIQFLYTRLAYINCGIATIGLVVWLDTKDTDKRRWAKFIMLQLLFTIGALIRVESALAVVLLLGAFSLFYLRDIKRTLFLFAYPLLLVVFLTSLITWEIKNGHEFHLQVEPDIEAQICQRNNLIPLSSMKTHKDSVLHQAVTEMMWCEPRVISPSYLRSLIMPEKFLYTDMRQWRRAFRDVKNTVWETWDFVMISLLFSFLTGLQIIRRRPGYEFSLWILFELSFWVLIIIQTYTVKINDRSFEPYLCLFILCHILYLLRATDLRHRFMSSMAVVFIFLLTLVHVYKLKRLANDLKEDLYRYETKFNRVKEIAKDRYLVVNGSSFEFIFLSNRPFHPIDYSCFKKIYITDAYVIPYIPDYRRFLEAECKCNIEDFPSFWDYLCSVHGEVVILSTSRRMDLLGEYMKEMHHYTLPLIRSDVVLEPVGQSNEEDLTSDVKIFYLRDGEVGATGGYYKN